MTTKYQIGQQVNVLSHIIYASFQGQPYPVEVKPHMSTIIDIYTDDLTGEPIYMLHTGEFTEDQLAPTD